MLYAIHFHDFQFPLFFLLKSHDFQFSIKEKGASQASLISFPSFDAHAVKRICHIKKKKTLEVFQ